MFVCVCVFLAISIRRISTPATAGLERTNIKEGDRKKERVNDKKKEKKEIGMRRRG